MQAYFMLEIHIPALMVVGLEGVLGCAALFLALLPIAQVPTPPPLLFPFPSPAPTPVSPSFACGSAGGLHWAGPATLLDCASQAPPCTSDSGALGSGYPFCSGVSSRELFCPFVLCCFSMTRSASG